ncbi:cation-translocating P-type ATPase [Haloarchaeobius sp. HME9146]|uniref:heavy metal translocating P-type ATPase n=1 Tax=Haloarchaeobius sp. HME9146 TaxID=2978732 RepID=UPI0021C16D39|nr:cation-translocating P-type ATPase [Haloarchaeobius sp. HME9146]MCT9094587.1 cation-translocating P-type ATPase [Haloarchaeobius sp. HME9146]
MSTQHPSETPADETADECSLCGLPTPEPPITAADVDGTFCCQGCCEVARQLGDVADVESPDDVRDAFEESAESIDDAETTYLAVDGMHCATCEAFLEGSGRQEAGVVDVDASYASELVRVRYDPRKRSEASLPDLFTTAGYRARLLDEEHEDDGTELMRLLVGGFFGMMTMLWYVLFLYPAYLGVNPDDLLMNVAGSAGQYLLANTAVMAAVVLGYTGYPILQGAYVSLRSGIPNMDLLVALAAVNAFVYSVAVLLTGGTEVYFDITVVVVLVVSIGNYYEKRIKRRATDRLGELTEEQVRTARKRLPGGDTVEVSVEDLTGGEAVLVKPGERVPVDGVVKEGTAAVDESLVTGESVPERVEAGDEVVGGAVVTDAPLVLEVAEDARSTLDRLVTLMWDIQTGRTGVQRLADRLAAVFVPLVLVVAVLAAGWQLVTGAGITAALLTGLAVLVVSCPCALGLATPLAVASAVGAALDEGIVVGDSSVFETATQLDVVAFDKTGTLTTGQMRVHDVVPGEGTTEDDLLARAGAVEALSEHPIGAAIAQVAPDQDHNVTDFEAHPGRGVSADVAGERVVVGHPDLFAAREWPVPETLHARVDDARASGNVPVVVGWAGAVRGLVVVGDDAREEWDPVVADLATDEREVAVITGDDERAAERFRVNQNVDHVFAGVPPEAKAEIVERLQERGTVAMVGDGSNDAPALATADLGIAMGGGTALAADAADVVLTENDLAAVSRVFELTRAAKRRVRQNLGWALAYNAIAIPVAATGNLNPLVAAVAMAASSLLVVANSSRSL